MNDAQVQLLFKQTTDLRENRKHLTSLESDELRLLGLAAGDADARRQARELRAEIKTIRQAIAETERQIATTLDHLDRPDTRTERIAMRARQREQLDSRPTTRRETE